MRRFVNILVVTVAGTVGACSTPRSGSSSPAEPPGDSPPAPTASAPAGLITSVTPDHAFLARSGTLTLDGAGTAWSSATKVDLGVGVTVTNTSVVSPTLLVVNFRTDATAATGPRDVRVTDGGDTITYMGVPRGGSALQGGFQVLSPLVLTLEGDIAQGSIALMSAQVIDTTTPLDVTQDASGAYPNLAVRAPSGFTSRVLSVTAFAAQVELAIDVSAPAGPADVALESGASGPTVVEFPAPRGLSVAARAPSALSVGTWVTGKPSSTYATGLYALTAPAAATILDFTVSTTSSSATPDLFILGADGRWSNMLNYVQAASGSPGAFSVFSTAATPLYGVTMDPSGSMGDYTVGVTSQTPAAVVAASAADGSMGTAAEAAGLPFVLTGGNLANASAGDWVKVVLPPGMTNIRAQTVGDTLTDVAVQLMADDGLTDVGGGPNETGGLVDVTFTGLSAASTYYVTFAPGQTGAFTPADATYTAIIRAF
jgi:hypothetical protein